jgi:hypothetical protein
MRMKASAVYVLRTIGQPWCVEELETLAAPGQDPHVCEKARSALKAIRARPGSSTPAG